MLALFLPSRAQSCRERSKIVVSTTQEAHLGLNFVRRDHSHSRCRTSPCCHHPAVRVPLLTSLGTVHSQSIFNPVLEQVRDQLQASEQELALSISLFILCQGGFPVIWSSVAEIIGRGFPIPDVSRPSAPMLSPSSLLRSRRPAGKPVYLVAYVIFILGSVVCSRADSMPLFIVFRMVQALGSSAVMSIGAGTLADIFEQEERGTKMGMFYATPLIGPALGPLSASSRFRPPSRLTLTGHLSPQSAAPSAKPTVGVRLSTSWPPSEASVSYVSCPPSPSDVLGLTSPAVRLHLLP